MANETIKIPVVLDPDVAKFKADIEKLKTKVAKFNAQSSILSPQQFAKDAASIERAYAQLSNKIKKANASTSFSDPKVQKQLSNMLKQADKEYNKFAKTVKSSSTEASSSIRSMVTNLDILIATLLSIRALKGVFDFVTVDNASLEQVLLQFEVLLDSATKAREQFAQLKGFADISPFNIDDLSKAQKILLNFGDASQKSLKTVADAASIIDPSQLDELSLAYARLSSGVDVGDSIRRLQELGAITRKELSAEGIEFDANNKLLSSIEDTMEAVNKVMNSKFEDGTERLRDTFTGALSTLQDSLTNLQRDATDDTFARLTDYLNMAIDKLDELRESGELDAFADKIDSALTSVLDTLVPLTVNLTKFLGAATQSAPAIVTLGKALIPLLIAGKVGTGLASLSTTLGILGPVATGAATGITGLSTAVAVLTGPIGLISIGVGALAGGMLYLADATTKAELAQAEYNDEVAKNNKSLQNIRPLIDDFDLLVNKTTKTTEEATKFNDTLIGLERTLGLESGALTSLADDTDALTEAVDKGTAAVRNRAEAVKDASVRSAAVDFSILLKNTGGGVDQATKEEFANSLAKTIVDATEGIDTKVEKGLAQAQVADRVTKAIELAIAGKGSLVDLTSLIKVNQSSLSSDLNAKLKGLSGKGLANQLEGLSELGLDTSAFDENKADLEFLSAAIEQVVTSGGSLVDIQNKINIAFKENQSSEKSALDTYTQYARKVGLSAKQSKDFANASANVKGALSKITGEAVDTDEEVSNVLEKLQETASLDDISVAINFYTNLESVTKQLEAATTALKYLQQMSTIQIGGKTQQLDNSAVINAAKNNIVDLENTQKALQQSFDDASKKASGTKTTKSKTPVADALAVDFAKADNLLAKNVITQEQYTNKIIELNKKLIAAKETSAEEDIKLETDNVNLIKQLNEARLKDGLSTADKLAENSDNSLEALKKQLATAQDLLKEYESSAFASKDTIVSTKEEIDKIKDAIAEAQNRNIATRLADAAKFDKTLAGIFKGSAVTGEVIKESVKSSTNETVVRTKQELEVTVKIEGDSVAGLSTQATQQWLNEVKGGILKTLDNSNDLSRTSNTSRMTSPGRR